jgi:hypothetical protein
VQVYAHEVIHQVIVACHTCKNIAHNQALISHFLAPPCSLDNQHHNTLAMDGDHFNAILLPVNAVNATRVSPVEDGILHVLLRKCCKRKLINRHHHNTNNLSNPDNFFVCQELTISFLHPDTVHSPNLGGIQETGNEGISDLG